MYGTKISMLLQLEMSGKRTLQSEIGAGFDLFFAFFLFFFFLFSWVLLQNTLKGVCYASV